MKNVRNRFFKQSIKEGLAVNEMKSIKSQEVRKVLAEKIRVALNLETKILQDLISLLD